MFPAGGKILLILVNSDQRATLGGEKGDPWRYDTMQYTTLISNFSLQKVCACWYSVYTWIWGCLQWCEGHPRANMLSKYQQIL